MGKNKISSQLMTVLLAILTLISKNAAGAGNGSAIVDVNPPFEIKWDLTQKDSAAEQEFVVTKYRFFMFLVEFKISGVTGPIPKEKLEALQEFTGNGESQQRVTKESANWEVPIVVPPYTREEQDFLASGGMLVEKELSQEKRLVIFKNKDGSIAKEKVFQYPPFVWQYTKAGAGVEVPIHFILDSLDAKKEPTTHIDSVIQTKGLITSDQRHIISLALRPGKYRLHVETLNDSKVPADVETYLLLTYNPKIIPSDAHSLLRDFIKLIE